MTAIEKALRFARHEARLARLRTLTAVPTVVTTNEQRMFDEVAADIAGDEEAESFLPFAHKFVAVEEARRDTMNRSFLGKLTNLLEDYTTGCGTVDVPVIGGVDNPVLRKDFEDGRTGFICAVEEGDTTATLRHLYVLLHHAEMEMRYSLVLPPFPPMPTTTTIKKKVV